MRDDEITLNAVERKRLLRWILALEGKLPDKKYVQTKNMLYRPDDLIEQDVKSGDGELPCGHCCLGVACDIYDPAMWQDPNDIQEKDEDSHITYNPFDYDSGFVYMGTQTELPQTVANWFGIKETDPFLTGIVKRQCHNPEPIVSKPKRMNPGDIMTARASFWNDNQGATFAEIASMLRAKYKIMDDGDDGTKVRS